MLNDPEKVLELIPPSARVLDIGAAESVFPRANAVIDILPYEMRQAGPLCSMPEQFGPGDWYIGDICDAEIWEQFPDQSFDFVICSHVLEDIRDPVYVCRQMMRVGKAGYIETPSRFRECAKTSPFAATAGWEHHRWILDVEGDSLVCTAKNPLIHHFDFMAWKNRRLLIRLDLLMLAVHWEGAFNIVERSQKGGLWEVENLYDWYRTFPVNEKRPLVHHIVNGKRQGSTFQWVTEFKLPVEDRLSAQRLVMRHALRSPRYILYRLECFVRVLWAKIRGCREPI